jgi:hypothetical protein
MLIKPPHEKIWSMNSRLTALQKLPFTNARLAQIAALAVALQWLILKQQRCN